MRPESFAMEVPILINTAGKVEVTDRFVEKVVQFDGFVAGGAGKWKVQGTLDGSRWSDITGEVAADGFAVIAQYAKQIRLYCTVAPAGTGPTVIFGGLDARAV